METILDIIQKRRSIREYQDKAVSRELLEKLLQAGMAAPSARNSKPWEFVVVTEKATLDKLRANLKNGNYNAPAAIVVLGNLKIATAESSTRFWVQDCTAAVENMLIAAAGLGLGTVWIGSYPKEDVMQAERDILGISQDVYPLALFYVGYPAEEVPPRTQYEAGRVHWEKY